MWKVLVLVDLLWGTNWVLMKIVNSYIDPLSFVTLRFGLGAIVLVTFCFWAKKKLPERRFVPWIILTGILQYSISNFLVQFCVGDLGAGLSAVISYTMPIWVALLAHFILHEELTLKKCMGIAISLIGLIVLMQIKLDVSVGVILLALCGAFFWGLASTITKWKLAACDATEVTAWQMVSGAVVFVLLSIKNAGTATVVWNTTSVLCLAYNVILATSLAFFLWTYVLDHMDASKAAISVMAVPAVGVLAGVICLGETLTVTSVIGMLLVLCGIIIVEKQ